MANPRLLKRIQRAIAQKNYRIRIHAIRHMVEEGFDERDLTEALTVKSKLLEDYPDEFRCLMLGCYSGGRNTSFPFARGRGLLEWETG